MLTVLIVIDALFMAVTAFFWILDLVYYKKREYIFSVGRVKKSFRGFIMPFVKKNGGGIFSAKKISDYVNSKIDKKATNIKDEIIIKSDNGIGCECEHWYVDPNEIYYHNSGGLYGFLENGPCYKWHETWHLSKAENVDAVVVINNEKLKNHSKYNKSEAYDHYEYEDCFYVNNPFGLKGIFIISYRYIFDNDKKSGDD